MWSTLEFILHLVCHKITNIYIYIYIYWEKIWKKKITQNEEFNVKESRRYNVSVKKNIIRT